jgi:AAA domain
MPYVDPKEILQKVRAKNAAARKAKVPNGDGGDEQPPLQEPEDTASRFENGDTPELDVEPWWRDAATIPAREVLYGRHYIRRNIGATIGAGGRMKTSYVLFEAVEMATGRNLTTGEALPGRSLRVLILNAEEDQDELDRRVAAICQHYGVTEADLGGRLFVKSVRDRPLRLATFVKGIATLNRPALAALAALIERRQADVFILDPWVSFHAVNESSNTDMDLVIKEGLGGIATRTNSAGEICHHPGKPKPGQAETTVEDARGASAILWAVRSARVFNFMTPDEASKLGISEDHRRRHTRITNGKANMGPLGKAQWIKIEVENLPNGDEVACASCWIPPNPFDGVTTADMELARQLAQTGAYRADNRSPHWFGYALADRLHIPIAYGANNNPKDLARVNTIIKTWLTNKVLKIETRTGANRHQQRFIIAGSFVADHKRTIDDPAPDDEEITLQ